MNFCSSALSGEDLLVVYYVIGNNSYSRRYEWTFFYLTFCLSSRDKLISFTVNLCSRRMSLGILSEQMILNHKFTIPEFLFYLIIFFRSFLYFAKMHVIKSPKQIKIKWILNYQIFSNVVQFMKRSICVNVLSTLIATLFRSCVIFLILATFPKKYFLRTVLCERGSNSVSTQEFIKMVFKNFTKHYYRTPCFVI